jgi:flavin-binding protein dodecin
MSVLKVIEVLGSSEKSWEDAAQGIIKEASKTVKNIRSIYLENLSAKVENNKIVEYRVDGKVTFEVKKMEEAMM